MNRAERINAIFRLTSLDAADFAGSGGGIVNADYAAAMVAGRERGDAELVRGIMRPAILGRFESGAP